MAAQKWFGTGWLNSGWVIDDWWAAEAGPPGFTAQLVSTQQDQFAGASRWISPAWLNGAWLASNWFGGGGWRLDVTGAPQQFTTTFDIPELDIVPQWIFRTGVGVTASLIPPTQQNQTALFKAQFSLGSDRIAQLARTQDDQVMVMRAFFAPNPDARNATLVVAQEPQTMLMQMTHVVTGGTGDKRYGRK